MRNVIKLFVNFQLCKPKTYKEVIVLIKGHKRRRLADGSFYLLRLIIFLGQACSIRVTNSHCAFEPRTYYTSL